MTPAAVPGELFLAEIREQPDAIMRLLEHEQEFDAVSRALVERTPSVVRLVGHGTSDAALPTSSSTSRARGRAER